jgi:Zn-dependent protease/CBS domain-containing protein
MVRLSIPLATFRGIPIRLHLTFAFVLGFLLWRTGTAMDVAVALLQSTLVLLLFVCVALHELGHATVALANGIPISEITLYPYGGVARLAHRPPDGKTELRIAAAGPAVNLALALLLIVLTAGGVLHPGNSVALRFAAFLMWANLLIAGFNLLPAFPLDGGRVLRGALAGKIGWIRATVWAASAGQVVAVVLMVAGIVHDPWLFLGGMLLFPGANSELRLALGLRALANERIRQVMLPEVQLVGPDASLKDLAAISSESPITEFIVHDGTRAVGYLPAARLWAALHTSPPSPETAAEVALPIGMALSESAPLSDALEQLERDRCDAAPVVDDGGTIIGVITRSAVARARVIAHHMKKRGFET